MLLSSSDFMKNYLWKYIDITINRTEVQQLKTNINYDQYIMDMFNRFKHIFMEQTDIENYVFIMSIIEPCYFDNFVIFYVAFVKKFGLADDDTLKRISTLNDLNNFVDNDEKKFKLMLLCLYYYF